MKKYLQYSLLIGLFLALHGPLPVAIMQDTEELPLATRGNYHVGERILTFVDEQRDGREIQVTLWYPAIVPEDQQEDLQMAESRHRPIRDLLSDMSSAPYPLVLYSHGYDGSPVEFNMILEPLVSHGFVVANLTHPNSDSAFTFIDRPLDVLFIIDQLAALNEAIGSALDGLVDVDQTGVIGFNIGAYTALAVSGARIDPDSVAKAWDGINDYYMRLTWLDWDWTAMMAYRDQFVPLTAGDPLWTPTTDSRIRAVVPYMPCDIYQFGERGLAAAMVPTLVIGASGNEWCGYDSEVTVYSHLGSADRDLLTLVGASFDTPSNNNTEPVVQHFVTAFFGYHLQENTDYASYLTEDYAESLENIVWGIDETAVNAPQFITELTFSEGGTVAVGDTIAGEIAEVGTRIGYSLTLDADTSLNIYANATRAYQFNLVLYVFDTQADLLFWNDEINFEDDAFGNFDAGLEGIMLPVGSYTIIVSGYGLNTGSYELVVESAK